MLYIAPAIAKQKPPHIQRDGWVKKKTVLRDAYDVANAVNKLKPWSGINSLNEFYHSFIMYQCFS
jgi:hypothetical protein